MNVITKEERESLRFLTDQQWSLYRYLRNFVANYGRTPSYAEIGVAMGCSRATVGRRMQELRWYELIRRNTEDYPGTAVPEPEPEPLPESLPEPEPETEPETEPRKAKPMLIEEPEQIAVEDMTPGQPFYFPEELKQRVFTRARGDAGDRGAANVACVCIAVDDNNDSEALNVGSIVSVPKFSRVHPLQLSRPPLYRKV